MMFYGSTFNQPLNNWNVSNVENMSWMFAHQDDFQQDISNWDVSNVKYFESFSTMFLKEEYKPSFIDFKK